MKHLIVLQSMLLLALPFSIKPASTSYEPCEIKGSMSAPVTKFEPRHYANASFKLHDWGLGGLRVCLRRASNATQKNAKRMYVHDPANPESPMGLTQANRKLYDYVYALREIEKELLHKPFKDWRVSDIQEVNAMLTILTTQKPGRFRTQELPMLILDHNTDEDIERIEMCHSNPLHMTAQDKQWIENAVHIFPQSKSLQARMKTMLQTVSKSLRYIEADTATQPLHAEIHTIAYIHHQIASSRPWPKRNKATARVLGNIILMQHGVIPPTFEDETEYRAILHRSLQENNITHLTGHIFDRIVADQ